MARRCWQTAAIGTWTEHSSQLQAHSSPRLTSLLASGLNGLGKAVLCAFTLLPNKEKDSYLRLAACIRDKLSQLPKVKVKNIMMDYEKGLISAFKTSFPGVSLAGCDFHWKSCLRFFTIQLLCSNNQWIGELNPHTKIRKYPAYSHDLWNKFKAVMNGDHRANNIMEGFNHGSVCHFLPVQRNGPLLKVQG